MVTFYTENLNHVRKRRFEYYFSGAICYSGSKKCKIPFWVQFMLTERGSRFFGSAGMESPFVPVWIPAAFFRAKSDSSLLHDLLLALAACISRLVPREKINLLLPKTVQIRIWIESRLLLRREGKKQSRFWREKRRYGGETSPPLADDGAEGKLLKTFQTRVRELAAVEKVKNTVCAAPEVGPPRADSFRKKSRNLHLAGL